MVKQLKADAEEVGNLEEAGKNYVHILLAAFNQMLKGVGVQGEGATWPEEHQEGDRAMHLRRLLTPQEFNRIGGKIRDIRGTPEERTRLQRMAKIYRVPYETAVRWEYGDIPIVLPHPPRR